jgi:hypothetical protein
MAIATNLVSAPPTSIKAAADRPLTLDLVLRELASDGLVESATLEALRSTAKFRSYDHPLALIADQKWRSSLNGSQGESMCLTSTSIRCA